MKHVRVALAMAVMAFTLGASFVPHPSHAMTKLQTCVPHDGVDPGDDGDPEDYDCYPDSN
jgi:hypothetical protein